MGVHADHLAEIPADRRAEVPVAVAVAVVVTKRIKAVEAVHAMSILP